MMRKYKIISLVAGIGVLLFGIFLWSLHTSVGTLSINGTDLQVRIARHALAQKKGLSGYTDATLAEDGMIFLFPQGEVRTFWMKGMQFDLDILWIAQGKIVAIDRNVRAPLSRTDEPETVTSAPLAVDAVLELPAGKADYFGLVEGMSVVLSK